MTDDETERDAETDGGVARDDIYATEEQGKEYQETVYEDIGYDRLEEAPATGDYPKSDGDSGFRVADLPKVPKVKHIIGPSAIMLGAALGSGESLFWPSLIAENGWALYWAFWVGVLTQFFINTELQRWALATGESIFGGYKHLHRIWPWFFLVAGFFHIGWPGWVAGASEVFAVWTGVVPRNEWWIIGVISMVLIWLSYQAGPVMYNIVENVQTVLMAFAIVFAVILVFISGSIGQLANVPAGAISFGTLPADMDIAVFLGGLAYAGAGGYINLSQGVWAREKGFGMGTYQGRVKNPLRGRDPEDINDGFAFEPTDTNMRRWKGWWKIVQQEHFLTFVVGLLVVGTIMMTITAEFVPAGAEVTDDALSMWIDLVIPSLGGIVGWLLFAMLVIALFSTEYAIIEVFVRNSVDILYQNYGRAAGWNVGRVFFWALTVFVAWGIGIILASEFIAGFGQPWFLLVIGAAIAGVMMWPYNALTIILNTTRLPEHTQPGWGRVVAMWWATGFFGYFSVLLIGSLLTGSIASAVGIYLPALQSVLESFTTTVAVMGSGIGGYLLWLFALVVQIYTMYRSARAKLDASGTVEDADEASGFFA